MYAETTERVLSQMVLLSGLLVGFSFAGTVALLALRSESRTVSSTIVAFMTAAVLLLYTAMVAAITLAYPLDALNAEQFARLARFYPFLQWPFRLGLLAVLTGIGLLGWIRSRRLGIISTGLALAAGMGWLAWALFLRALFG